MHKPTFAILGIPVASFLLLAPAKALAVTYAVGGTLSYESIRPEGFYDENFDDENLGGLGIAGLFQAEVTKLGGSTGLLLGAEIERFSTEGEERNNKYEFTQTTFGPFLGLSVPVAPRFTLQTTLGFDFGVSGEFSRKISSGLTLSRKTESFGRVTHDWRGIFDVTPNVGVGFGLGWHAGSTELADLNYETDFRGWGMKGVFLYTF